MSVAPLLLAAAVSAATLAPARVEAQPSGRQTASELDAFITKGMDQWKIPGLSIAIVRGDSVVYAKGFGVRTVGEPARVDTDTRFGIMSTTKAMTALAVAMLVDSGKVAWDDPVTRHLPWFALSDPYVTRELTVRDLLRHNAGLGNADLLWVRADLDARQILERLRRLPMAYSLRDGFIYQNVMYQVAGEVVAAASGMSWERFVETRILVPIGMARSNATLDGMLRQARATNDQNVSSAHWSFDGDIRPIAEFLVDPVPAAGSAWMSANDAARWLRFLLDSGRVNGRRLVSEKNFRELFKPQAFVPPGEFYPTAALTKPHWTTYALGWFQQDYRGRYVAMHTGSIDGRTAIIGLMPDERLGVMIFGNVDHAEFRHALMWRVFDVYTGAPMRDWSSDLLALYGARAEAGKQAAAARDAARIKGTSPSRPLMEYAGTFEHPVYGDIVVTFVDGTLTLRFGSLPENRGLMEHWHHDTFSARLGDGRGGRTMFAFRLDAAGKVAALRFDDSADLEFVRVRR
ncbi:MAG: serine hydrolase [Gemmatimonadaceae bacterium]